MLDVPNSREQNNPNTVNEPNETSSSQDSNNSEQDTMPHQVIDQPTPANDVYTCLKLQESSSTSSSDSFVLNENTNTTTTAVCMTVSHLRQFKLGPTTIVESSTSVSPLDTINTSSLSPLEKLNTNITSIQTGSNSISPANSNPLSNESIDSASPVTPTSPIKNNSLTLELPLNISNSSIKRNSNTHSQKENKKFIFASNPTTPLPSSSKYITNVTPSKSTSINPRRKSTTSDSTVGTPGKRTLSTTTTSLPSTPTSQRRRASTPDICPPTSPRIRTTPRKSTGGTVYFADEENTFFKYIDSRPSDPPSYDITNPTGSSIRFPIFEDLTPVSKFQKPPDYLPTVHEITLVSCQFESLTPYEKYQNKFWKNYIMEINSTQLNFFEIDHNLIKMTNNQNLIRNYNDGEISNTLLNTITNTITKPSIQTPATNPPTHKHHTHGLALFNNKYAYHFNYTDVEQIISMIKKNPQKYLTNDRLMKSFTLQYAKVGLAIEQPKTSYILRLRCEQEQFIVWFTTIDELINWSTFISMGISVSLDLNERELPKYRVVPGRRRRDRRHSSTSRNYRHRSNSYSSSTTANRNNGDDANDTHDHILVESNISSRSSSISGSATTTTNNNTNAELGRSNSRSSNYNSHRSQNLKSLNSFTSTRDSNPSRRRKSTGDQKLAFSFKLKLKSFFGTSTESFQTSTSTLTSASASTKNLTPPVAKQINPKNESPALVSSSPKKVKNSGININNPFQSSKELNSVVEEEEELEVEGHEPELDEDDGSILAPLPPSTSKLNLNSSVIPKNRARSSSLPLDSRRSLISRGSPTIATSNKIPSNVNPMTNPFFNGSTSSNNSTINSNVLNSTSTDLCRQSSIPSVTVSKATGQTITGTSNSTLFLNNGNLNVSKSRSNSISAVLFNDATINSPDASNLSISRYNSNVSTDSFIVNDNTLDLEENDLSEPGESLSNFISNLSNESIDTVTNFSNLSQPPSNTETNCNLDTINQSQVQLSLSRGTTSLRKVTSIDDAFDYDLSDQRNMLHLTESIDSRYGGDLFESDFRTTTATVPISRLNSNNENNDHNTNSIYLREGFYDSEEDDYIYIERLNRRQGSIPRSVSGTNIPYGSDEVKWNPPIKEVSRKRFIKDSLRCLRSMPPDHRYLGKLVCKSVPPPRYETNNKAIPCGLSYFTNTSVDGKGNQIDSNKSKRNHYVKTYTVGPSGLLKPSIKYTQSLI
ncbi:hypothetical protein TBLA_0B01060 [Henningerozyma blattae CBS 6284]|uniref:PH domain-containing protein n=1 Tax=Henningerozyma blattae (strain ATCC 34711 / CBS 6284 / DSM 70876 / NBRC 10599 / NRRL Y-10934 / UCD 77-7) TaxID=1071380 RepID=I2GXU7_HENB6|nr:hypothetical protein TBLA_0B01060 [Tetrapisispora blattae CBS 6284]CCH58949.1 hypothetical protein TBLA_0B01060 [Tetrapisispora blattae CBS 6284]